MPGSLSPDCEPSLSGIQRKIQSADDYSRSRQNASRDVRIDELIQVMQQKSALVGLHACPAFKPVF